MKTNLNIIISIITGRKFFYEEESNNFLQILNYLFDEFNKESIKNTGACFNTFSEESEMIAREYLLLCHPELRKLSDLIMGIADKEDNKVMSLNDYNTCMNAIDEYNTNGQIMYDINSIPVNFKVEQPKIMVIKKEK